MQLDHFKYANMSKTEKQKGESSKCRFQSICVFGGSTTGKDRAFVQAANELGRELATRKINLVYGGGIRGLKGSVAWSAIFGGSDVLSITLKDFPDNSNGITIGTELKVPTIPQRMGNMFNNAEAFIAIPGGVDTLEEISNIVSWTALNIHKKPLGLLNTNGFYDSLLSFLDHAVEQEFLPQAIRHAIISAPTVVQLLDQLQNFEPEPSMKKVDKHKRDKGKDGAPDTTLRL